MEVRNEEMTPFGELFYQEQKLLEERYKQGEVEYFNYGLEKWCRKGGSLWYSSTIYRTKPKEEGQQMKETQHCNENSFPWHMVDSEWNAVARDGNYPNWYLYKEKPIRDGEEIRWWPEFVSGYTSLSENAQEVIGVDMSKWNDIPWEERLMLRPGYQEKEEEGNYDDVLSEEEADHSVNSVKDYPVVKMKHLCNYKVGDVVRLKKTGELVELSAFEHYNNCRDCALYDVENCVYKTCCYDIDNGEVYFKPVEEQ